MQEFQKFLEIARKSQNKKATDTMTVKYKISSFMILLVAIRNQQNFVFIDTR